MGLKPSESVVHGGLAREEQEVLTMSHSRLLRGLTAAMILGHWCIECQ